MWADYFFSLDLEANNVVKKNTVIVPPVYIGENVTIENSVVGPHVSIGENSVVKGSIIQNSIIQTNSELNNVNIKNSMVGNFVRYNGESKDISVGDYNVIS